MARATAVSMLASLLATGCGDKPPIERAPPLGPEHYAIAPEDRPEPGRFVRYAEPGAKPGGLDIAVTDYVHPDGKPPVRLVGVVHVADAPYYAALQRELDECALVLFEAVKPEDLAMTDWIRGQDRARDELAGFQHEIAGWFGFRWQLDAIDYSSSRFVHADMTTRQFREEGGSELLPDVPLDDAEDDDEMPSSVRGAFQEMRALGRYAMEEDNPLRSMARKAFAEALGTSELERMLEMFPKLSDLVLVRRNGVAMDKLEEVLPSAAGRIGIFYGAAHMPGMERILTSPRFGYRRDDGRWYRAWALRASLR